jgi:hypothetical protein
LSLGEAIDRIVKQDVGNVNIPSRDMWKVAATYGQTVPVPSYCEDSEFRTSQFHPCGDGQRSAVNSVKTIGIRKERITTCTTDSGNNHNLVMRYAQLLYRVIETLLNPEIPASRAPRG